MTNNSYEITVYADSLMQTELKKDTLNIDYHEDLVLILGMEEDLRDGEDWWDDIVDEVEDEFGDKWNCIEIVSSNKQYGRILERDYCVLLLKPKNDFVWMSKLFLFGKDRCERIGETFAGSLIFSDELSKIQSNHYYRYGSDANVIAMIKEIAGSELYDCNVVDVVINPSDQSITAMTLIDHYKLMLFVPTKLKVGRLKQIFQSVNICTEVSYELSNQRQSIRINGLSDLQFLENTFDQVQIMLDAQSEKSLFSTLKNEFKPMFDF